MSYGAVGQRDSGNEGHGEEGTRNQLGLWNGVVVPCLLNILGVILFLRLGWAISQVGWAGLLAMFAVGEALSLLTVLSLAAIVSNGQMRGGGSYYMISRCLGPEFGGSIGLLFYFAYAVGTSFYVMGFASEIVDTFMDIDEEDESSQRLWNTVVASAALALVMAVSLAGAGFFTKINRLLFLGQFAAILIGIWSMLFTPAPKEVRFGTYVGPNIDTLMNNTWPDMTEDDKCGGVRCTWSIVFGIIFPAVTGIMEGANLSGDLKDPAGSIGKGTLIAVFGAIMTYLALIFSTASAFPRETLRRNMSPMQDVAPSKYIIVIGIAISTSSSALGSVFGGSRVLQALARDDHPFPGLAFFAQGSVHGDEPRRAVVLTWLVAQMFCLMGSLDVISPIISSFFCLSYASVNFCCLVLDLSGTPNFRPRFKYYNRWTSLVGCLLNIAMLFFLDVWYATISICCLLVLFLWIAYKGPAKSWGDVSQAILFHQVRKYLLRLDERKEHVKYWRPSVLLFVSEVDGPLIDFCNNLKKGGLYVLGSVLVGDSVQLGDEALTLRKSWMSFISAAKIKALPNVAIGGSARGALQNLMLCSGLGGMRPNTLVLPFFKSPVAAPGSVKLHSNSIERESEYVAAIKDALKLHLNVIIACNFDRIDRSLVRPTMQALHPAHEDDLEAPLLAQENPTRRFGLWKPPVEYVDVWIIGEWRWKDLDGTLSLQLQLAHILHLNPLWDQHTKIRYINLTAPPAGATGGERWSLAAAEAKGRLLELCRETRIRGEVDVMFASSPALSARGSANSERSLSLLDVERTTEMADAAREAVEAVENQDRSRRRTDGQDDRHQKFEGNRFQKEMEEMNKIILSRSSTSKLLFLVLPPMPQGSGEKDANAYIAGTSSLIRGLPPTILLAAGEQKNVIPQEL